MSRGCCWGVARRGRRRSREEIGLPGSLRPGGSGRLLGEWARADLSRRSVPRSAFGARLGTAGARDGRTRRRAPLVDGLVNRLHVSGQADRPSDPPAELADGRAVIRAARQGQPEDSRDNVAVHRLSPSLETQGSAGVRRPDWPAPETVAPRESRWEMFRGAIGSVRGRDPARIGNCRDRLPTPAEPDKSALAAPGFHQTMKSQIMSAP